MRAPPEPVRAAARAAPLALTAFVLLQSTAAGAALALPALAAGAAIAGHRGELDFGRRPSRGEWALAALAAAWLVATLASARPWQALGLSVPPLAACIIALLLSRARCDATCRGGLAALLLAAAGVQSLQVLWAAVRGGAVGPDAVQLADVLWLVVPNDLAWTALALAAVPACWRASEPRAARIAVALAASVIVAAILVAQSRLALLCAVIVLGGHFARRQPLPAGLLAVAVGGLLVLAWDKGLASLASRAELWRAAFELGIANPLHGIGPGGYGSALENLAPAAGRIDPRAIPWPHNLPLEAFVLLGLPGLAALLAVAWVTWRRATPSPDRIAMIAAVALIALLEATLLRTWVWCALALACAGLPGDDTQATKDGHP
jgi:hypothetical protein